VLETVVTILLVVTTSAYSVIDGTDYPTFEYNFFDIRFRLRVQFLDIIE
jgi:hypothetical protein